MAEEDTEQKAGNMASPGTTINGPSSAAILLMAMGEENAANVLKHMGPDDVQAIGEAMTDIGAISQSDIGSTLDSFIQKVESESFLSVSPGGYLNDTLVRALGSEKAIGVMSKINKDSVAPALDALKWMPERVIGKLIRDEHPQFIAIVLSYLDRDKAASVLQELPESKKVDVVIRVSSLDTVHPAALKEIDAILEKRVNERIEMEFDGAGGIKTAAEILNGVSTDQEEVIIEKLTEIDAELSEKIKENMFVFDNILNIDDRGVQTLLRDIQNDILVKALKGANQDVQAHIFKNMSSRAAVLLKDDLEAQGPMRLAEVEEAQKEILTVAMTMAEDGKISLGGKNDDFV